MSLGTNGIINRFSISGTQYRGWKRYLKSPRAYVRGCSEVYTCTGYPSDIHGYVLIHVPPVGKIPPPPAPPINSSQRRYTSTSTHREVDIQLLPQLLTLGVHTVLGLSFRPSVCLSVTTFSAATCTCNKTANKRY